MRLRLERCVCLSFAALGPALLFAFRSLLGELGFQLLRLVLLLQMLQLLELRLLIFIVLLLLLEQEHLLQLHLLLRCQFFVVGDLLRAALDAHLLLGGLLYDHLVALDVAHALCVLALLLLLLELPHELLLDQLLGEGELVGVLLVLLLQELKQHLPVRLVQLVQVDHDVLVILFARVL